MASGHVNRTNRPNTWLHRPSLRREVFPCQLGAVHTWHKASFAAAHTIRTRSEQSGHRASVVASSKVMAKREPDRHIYSKGNLHVAGLVGAAMCSASHDGISVKS